MNSRVFHTIEPIFDSGSRVLILGSFPSVKSRESQFYYGNPRNRFWLVLAALFEEPVPDSIAEKRRFLLRNKIAVWDVVQSCEITGSSDSSIREPLPNDLNRILSVSPISRIFTNGSAAARLYKRFCFPLTNIEAVPLPSTSPANATADLQALLKTWICVKEATENRP